MADWAIIEEGQNAATLESSALAQSVVAVMREHVPELTRSPAKMLELLHDAAESEGLNPDEDKDFPKHANWLWRKLVPVIPTLESFGITASEGQERDGEDGKKKRYIRFMKDDTDGPPTDGVGQHGDSRDSTENMVSRSDPHTYAPGTAGTAGIPYLSKKGKNTEGRIDKGTDAGPSLQDGKNAVPAVPVDPSAYLSQPERDTISIDAVPEGENAVPEAPDPPVEALLDDPPSWFRNQVNRHIEANTDVAIEPLCRAVAVEIHGDDKRWPEVEEPITRWLEDFFDDGEEF
jgi:hypothetical protein